MNEAGRQTNKDAPRSELGRSPQTEIPPGKHVVLVDEGDVTGIQ